MFSLNKLDPTLALVNKDRKFKDSSSPLIKSNINSMLASPKESDTLLKMKDIHLKQRILEEKIDNMREEMITRDSIDSCKKEIEKFQPFLTYLEEFKEKCNDEEKFLEEKIQFFRLFIWRFCSDTHNWKILAHSIYHIEHLINNLENYQIKEFIQKPFQIILKEFILFIKDLITIQVKSQKHESDYSTVFANTTPSPPSQEINSNDKIDQHIQNLKTHFANLKELISTTQERFNICQTDINAIQILLKAINDINFHSQNLDQQDQDKIRFLTLKQDLSQKSNKNDLIQFKTYIDNQIKKLLELNKQNAKELHRIKLLKTATPKARHIQTILSSNLPSPHQKIPNRIYSSQSSRPYITYDLDHIRKYQRQALIKSPYGTIPLYRRQAWVKFLKLRSILIFLLKAAANLFPNHSLHFLRYMQNSLRMQVNISSLSKFSIPLQIHNLIGYDPSDIYSICNKTKPVQKKKKKKNNMEIFHTQQDLSILGNDNKLYRGRINSCEIIPLKKIEHKKLQMKDNNPITKIPLDQLDQTITDEHLFEYLDWQREFKEQDLPNELCEELFNHWKSIICEDQICICKSESNEEQQLINTSIESSVSLDIIYDERCLCSECSCPCEKYDDDHSICLCSKCSCKCLKDFQSDDQDDGIKMEDSLIKEELQLVEEIIPIDQKSVVEFNESEIIGSDCFTNRADQWTKQFDIFQGFYQSTSLLEDNDWSIVNDIPPNGSQFQTAAPIAFEFNKISINKNLFELDDPTNNVNKRNKQKPTQQTN